MKNFVLVFIALIYSFYNSNAQIIVTPGQSATALAEILAGPGVVVSNAKYNVGCDSSIQSGRFNVTSSTIGMDSGIVLTSGSALLSVGVAGSPAQATNNLSDADLAILTIPSSSKDACVLEFDFVPIGDTIKFRYIFGSSEYQSFTCSSFVDAFGFFISGPGITGTFSNSSANLALLPSGCFVSVNTVNSSTASPCGTVSAPCAPPNNALFVNNPVGSTASGIAYNGYTQTLVATAVVVPCSTYHLKLAICDAADQTLDSGVFLEAGSLSSNNLALSFSTGFGVGNPFIVEGCDSLVIRVKRNVAVGSVVSADTVGIIVGGNAIMLADYSAIPPAMYFSTSPFDTLQTITVFPVFDGVYEGPEFITIRLSTGCAGAIADSLTIQIKDSLSFAFNTLNTQVCSGQPITTSGVGYPGTIFSWTPTTGVANVANINTIITPVAGTTIYYITGTYLGCPSQTKSFTVSADPLPTLGFQPSFLICPGKQIQLQAPFVAGQGVQYSWSPGTNLSCTLCPFPIAFPTTTNNYTITATSPNGCVNKDTIQVKVVPLTAAINASKDSTCIGDIINLQTVVSGSSATWVLNFGDGTFNANSLNNPKNYNPAGLYTAALYAQDTLGCKDTVLKNIYVDFENFGAFTVSDTTICLGEYIAIIDTIGASITNWEYDFGDNFTLQSVHNPVHTFTSATNSPYTISLTTKTPKCNPVVKTRKVFVYEYPKVNLGADTTFCVGFNVGYSVNLSNDGSASYLWHDGSTNMPYSVNTPGLYYVTATKNNCSTSDSLIVSNDCFINIPNAFTPNADGGNNYFMPTNELTSGLISFSMTIFNRWGNEVFATTNINSRGWDGKLGGKEQPMGTYLYQISGVTKDGKRKAVTGNVTLVR